MKSTTVFRASATVGLLLFCLLALPLRAAAQTIDLRLTNVTVKEAIATLNQRENYSIAIRSDGIDMSRRVNVSATGATIGDVIGQIFAGQDISYTISGNIISVTKAAPKTPSAPQQKVAVRGVVRDEAGGGVAGATIIVSGTTLAAISGPGGEFTLNNVELPVELTVSLLGYEPKIVSVTTGALVEIVLGSSTTAIDEVVVVGYGRQKRVNVTGAIGTISGKDLNNRPVTNTAAALQGADPSLSITFGNGSVEGKNFDVQIRGAVSLNTGAPLILVDGIETGLTQINPNDIESVSVLKDASSTAIYGAKASAGVVLITTKNGQAGDAKINYNARYGFSWNTTSTDFLTTGYDYVKLTNEFTQAFRNHPGWYYTDDEMQMLLDRRGDATEHPDRPWVVTDAGGKYRWLGNFDWYGYLFKRQRPETEHNVSLTGGNDKINYYASGRYLYREGLFNNSAEDIYNGYSFRTKIEAEITPRLRYSNNVSAEVSKYGYGGFWEQDGSEGFMADGIIYSMANNISPTFVPVNPDGTTFMYSNGIQFANSPIGSGRGGVFADGRNRNARRKNFFLITNKLTYDITPNKDLKLNLDYTYRRGDNLGTYRSFPTGNTWNATQTAVVDFTNGSILDFYREDRMYSNGHTANAYLDYTHSWGDHNFSAVAGANLDDHHQSTMSVRQTGSMSEDLDFINMEQGTIDRAVQSNTAYRTLGFFGRLNYDYKGKYLFEISARSDGSSRFAPRNRWAVYPSGSLGWRISEENFWAPLRGWWNDAKIRLSYGSLGNQQVPNYSYFERMTIGSINYTFNNTDKAGYARIPNQPITDGLTWETVVSYNAGLDLSFLKGRLNVYADFYIRDTKDMLTASKTLPNVFGANEPLINAADLRTKGYEISVDWRESRIVAGKPFSYGVSVSLGDNVTTITKFDNPDKLLSDHYVGKRLGDLWGYTTAGLFKTDREAAEYQALIDDKAVNNRVYSSSDATQAHLMAGDVRFVDLDGNNVINAGDGTLANPGDRRVMGNDRPRYNYSLRGNLNWNGIDFAIFFQGVGQIDWMPHANSLYFWGSYAFPTTSFLPADFESKTWSEDNRNTYFPRRRSYQTSSAGSLSVVTDRYLQNARYLRLKNITLGYTIPVNKRIMEKLRVYVSAENLAYWSPLKKHSKYVDPEVAVTNAAGDNLYPYSRSFSAGIDITF